jgi:hypothetical protein
MNNTLVQLFSFSICIAAIIGLVRFKIISQVYFPFLILIWLGLSNEILSVLLINKGYSNAVNNNIYVLLESLLILLQFRNWGLFDRNRVLFYCLGLLFLVAWVIVNLIIFNINRFNSYFNILYSLTVVFMSIHMINRLVLEEKSRLKKNAIFLIAVGFIAFYTYNAIIEIFWVYGLNASRDFRVQVYRVMTWINLSVNFIYALAVLWMPRKREYTLL